MAPTERKFSKNHEWIIWSDGIARIGITEYAQASLGDITFVELPSVGDQVIAGENIGSIESIKTTSEIYSPVTGTVVAINEALEVSPEIINQDPYQAGWLFAIRGNMVPDDLLDADAYDLFCKKEES